MTPEEIDAAVALQQEWETNWFGAPENDRDEVLEVLERREHERLWWDGDVLAAASWWWGNHTIALVRPGHEQLTDEVVAWLEETGAQSLEVLDRDEAQLSAVRARGWEHHHSGFELIRQITPDWVLDEPVWPEGYAVTGIEDERAIHELVYERTGWTDVRGHHHRPFEEWQDLLLNPKHVVPELQVVVTHDGVPVGVALCRTFADGTGWIAQLAVDDVHKGKGLGRALLLEGLRRQAAAGATALGLGVSAENRKALSLYLGVGLTIDREWLNHVPPSR